MEADSLDRAGLGGGLFTGLLGIIVPNLAPAAATAKNHLSPSANALHTFSLAIVLCVSGCFVSWNAVVASGFGSGLLALLVVAAGYVCLMMCVCELSSAIPFSGGSYGFARVAFGHLPSVLVGLAELLEYSFCAAIEALSCANMISTMGLQDEGDRSSGPMLEGLWMLFVYVIWNLLLWDSRTFWVAMVVGMIMTFTVLTIYLISIWSLLPHSPTSFAQNAAASGALATFLKMSPADPATSQLPNWFTPNFVPMTNVLNDASQSAGAGFFSVLPVGIWFLCAVEGTVLGAEETLDGKTTVAAGAIPAICVYALVCIVLLITAAATPAGLYNLATCTYATPLACGMEQVWPVSSSESLAWNRNWFNIFGFIGVFWSGLGLLYASTRVLFALSRAGHMPPFLAVTNSRASPYRAAFTCSLIGYIICLIARYSSTYGEDGSVTTNTVMYGKITTVVFNLLVLGGLVMYFIIFACFVVLRTKLKHIPRAYHSPLHLPGCAYGATCFMLCFISIWMFQPFMKETAIAFVVWFTCGLIYYYAWGRSRLLLSPEERFALPARRVDAHQIMETGLGFAYLRAFAETEHSTEVPDCWAAAAEYLKHPSIGKYHHMFTTHLKPSAPEQVNLPSELYISLQTLFEDLSSVCNSMGGSITEAADAEASSTFLQAVHESKKIIKYNAEPAVCSLLDQGLVLVAQLQDELSRIIGLDTLSRFFASPQFSAYLAQEPLLFAPQNVSNLTKQTRHTQTRRTPSRQYPLQLSTRRPSLSNNGSANSDGGSRRGSALPETELASFDHRAENPFDSGRFGDEASDNRASSQIGEDSCPESTEITSMKIELEFHGRRNDGF